jgi:hypothetical protein
VYGHSFYFVKKEKALLAGHQFESIEEIEDYFEHKTSVGYILFCIESLNEYTRENYKKRYIPELKEKISLYKKENKLAENFLDS